MPTIDEAIERAARAAWAIDEPNIAWDSLEPSDHAHLITVQRAALSAFLADVPVSEGMEKVGAAKRSFNVHETAREGFKDMCSQLAEEIQ